MSSITSTGWLDRLLGRASGSHCERIGYLEKRPVLVRGESIALFFYTATVFIEYGSVEKERKCKEYPPCYVAGIQFI